MATKFLRGSEWRKWDLHIHTPKSIVQQYGGDTPEVWDAFIARLASLPSEVKAIAVTDYLFCEGYEQLLTRRDEIPNIELIMPNIEFRLNTFSGTVNNKKRHNFHVLFDSAVSVQDIREQLLSCLATGYKIQNNEEWRQAPTPRSLQELGRLIKAAAPADNTVQHKTDLEVGFDNITYSRSHIEELLEKTPFKGRYVTAIGYSEWDQSRWDQSAAEKRDLINAAHFSLTSLDAPEAIAANRAELVAGKLNSLILHSSDSHTLARVGQTLLWIKADPTFAGLKQVLNEPDARVFIGQTPPNYKPDHKVIAQISIPASKGWFADGFTLDLNRDLVTVIGGRGSGKSALAEAIAFGAGSHDDSEDAFLKKAAKHQSAITGTPISVTWADGTKTEFEVGTSFEDRGLVQYLPQGAVEELCSHRNSEKLQAQVENVIFQALDDTQRFGASDFDELRARILSDFKYEKDDVVGKIRDLNKKLAGLIAVIKSGPEKMRTLGEKRNELDRLNKSLPELPPEDKAGQEELVALSELKRRFESKIVEYNGRLSKLTEIETKLKVFKSQIAVFRSEIGVLLASAGIAEAATFEVQIDETGIRSVLDKNKLDISGVLKILREGERTEVAKLLGLPLNQLPFDNLTSLNRGIEEKQKQTRAFETTKLKYQQQKKAALALEGTIKALEAEIARISVESQPEKERLEVERMAIYSSYFALLQEEKTKMEELYKPLQETLLAGTETDKRLVFEAQIRYRLDDHCRTGLDIIDRSRRGNFREVGRLKSALAALRDEFERHSFAEPALREQLEKILLEFTTFEGGTLPIEEQLRESYTMEDFLNWLFDPTNFEIVSSMKFDSTDLYLLSPGQKGIILLMLYLKIDTEDNRPLIIDQPEENLDNLSVYKDLINYFRERKQYRQIIMVTHNPNLVVNTDAEQIVVANYDGARTPRLVYSSGSLEDQAEQLPNVPVDQLEDGIIEQVCNILEGGERAFEKRKKKYQISTKSHV